MQFDPAKIDPATMLRMTTLMQKLGPDKLMRLQTLMHNLQAGVDVRREMEEFDKELPPGFREELLSVVMAGGPEMASAMSAAGMPGQMEPAHVEPPKDVREARLVILRAVADGKLSPDEAEPLLR